MADIRKRKNSNGSVSYQVRYPSSSAKSGYVYKSFGTAKEARAFREDSRNRDHKELRSTNIKAVSQAVDKWLDICFAEGTENHEPVTRYTLKTYEYRASIMKKYDWQKPLQELRPSDIRDFKSWLIKNCAGRHQAMKVLSSFHTVIQEMALRDIVASNVVAGISINMDSRHKKRIVPPTENEVMKLLAASDRLANSKNKRIAASWQRYRPIMYLAADTGARPQEYLAVPKHNVATSDLKIDRAIERGGYKISVTKTGAGWRWVDLSPEPRDMILHYADKHAVSNKHDLIFPTASGHWQCIDHWRRRGFQKACEEAGLMVQVEEDGEMVEKPKFSPYDLRHFYASMLIEQRTNLKRLQMLLGHEDIKTTLNTYGHLIERVEAKQEKHTGLLGTLGNNSCGADVASV